MGAANSLLKMSGKEGLYWQFPITAMVKNEKAL
jgi:hypothetical protein